MIRRTVYVTGLRGIPGIIGGVESHCEELLPRIAARAPDLDIEVLGRSGFVGREPHPYKGVIVRGLPAPAGTATEAIGGTASAILHAWRKRADLIHIHAIGPALLAPLARILGLQVVLTHHGRDYDRAKWGWFAKAMLRLGEWLGVLSAKRVIVVAPSLATDLRRAFPSRAANIRYIPNGAPALDESVSADAVLGRFALKAKGYVLAVGRLVPEKGFDYLIRAFRSSGTGRTLVIAGSAVHDSAFARAVAGEASDDVRFIGQQPRGVLRRLYENADLFVLPSFHEGLAISALEAAACGVPMLLSDIVPNHDLGLPPGNYFPVGNEQALAAKLALPGDRFAYEAGAVRNRFDWDLIADQTLGIYREILAST